MPIKTSIISNDKKIYEAWPDVALTTSGKLICVFCECAAHGDRSYSHIVYCESTDRGETWSEKKSLSDEINSDGSLYWNNPRISHLDDGRMVIVCDKIYSKDQCQGKIFIWYGNGNGENWEGPFETPIEGIVPDKLLDTSKGRWIVTAHLGKVDGFKNLQQRLWYSDDKGKTWAGPIVVGKDENLKLCEGSILELPDRKLVCFMREESAMGLECYKSISNDNGLTWSNLSTIPLDGCHRPVSGFLNTGEIMISYRYRQGGQKGWLGKWTQNVFLALTDIETVCSDDRKDQWTRIMPLDYDASPKSDLGYTGWVQFEDGMIFIVNYITYPEEKSYIKGYSLYREDIGG